MALTVRKGKSILEKKISSGRFGRGEVQLRNGAD